MGFSFKEFLNGINIFPSGSSASDQAGDLEVLSSTNKLYYHNGSTSSIIPTVTSTDTLTNKALSDSTTTIVDVSDATKIIKFDAAGTTGTSTTITGSQTSNRVLTLPDATDTLVGKATTDTFTNKTFDADGSGNSITNIENADIKSGANIARNKLASGTASHVLINDGSGVMSSETSLAVSRGGTNSGTALNNNRVMISSSSAIVEASAITASRALVSNVNGIPTHSTVTTTELGYVSGVTSAIQTQLNAIVALTFPSGVILPYGGSAAPSSDWLLCYGQAVSRATYSTLFTAIGTTYGVGDGATTFNLPDLRGRTPIGKDDMGGSAASRITNAISGFDGTTLGAAGGSHTHIQNSHTHTGTTGTESVSHTHTFDVYNDPAANGTFAGGRGSGAGISGSVTTGTQSVNHTHSFTTNSTTATNQNTGGDGAHRNVQPSIIINYIIKI
jgi:microcystin-dependent protein